MLGHQERRLILVLVVVWLVLLLLLSREKLGRRHVAQVFRIWDAVAALLTGAV